MQVKKQQLELDMEQHHSVAYDIHWNWSEDGYIKHIELNIYKGQRIASLRQDWIPSYIFRLATQHFSPQKKGFLKINTN